MDIIEIIVLIVVGMAFVGGGMLLGEFIGGVVGLVLYVIILSLLGIIPSWIWVLIIVLIFIIVVGIFIYAFSGASREDTEREDTEDEMPALQTGQGLTEDEMLKHIKWFLGLNFQGDYTVIKFEQQLMDRIKVISLNLSDESFKEITTFLESINLTEDTTYSEDKTVKYIDGWHKDEDANNFMKFHEAFSTEHEDWPFFVATLTVDCDNKTLTYEQGGS